MGKALQSPEGVRAIVKGFVVLEAVVSLGGSCTISELVTKCGLPAATVHRILRTLVDIGYLRQDASRLYMLGSRILFLADMAPSVLHRVAMPDLNHLAQTHGETFTLGRIESGEVFFSAEATGQHSMRHNIEVGSRGPIHATAMGKAILASWSEEAFEEWLASAELVGCTPNTITDPQMLREELRLVRASGVAYDNEEQELTVRAVAVAVPQTTVRTALMMSGPAHRMTDELIAAALPDMEAVAGVLRREFCAPDPGAPITFETDAEPVG